ncbi:peptide ABC transporter substrate-binding protein (plasmid) [Phyllobacterium zundukense]|nr:peptide ABC transporter substrate-binding protein [Phyllobacterium zundukense]
MTRRMLLATASGLGLTLAAAALPVTVWAQDNEPVRGGVLKIASLGLDTADPHRHTGSIGVQQIYVEGLTSIANDGTAKPFLAERFEVSEDGLSYTFHLREGVKFHNGDTMTSADVLANFERVKSNVQGGWLASAMKFTSGFEAPDEHTFVVRMSAPYAPFLNLISELWILSPKSTGWNDTITQPIGTGPFLFGKWAPNVQLSAPAFADYWQEDLPYLDAVEFDLRDAGDSSLALRAGDLHIGSIDVDSIADIKATTDVHVEYLKGTSVDYFTFNNRKARAPLDNPRVREAIVYALDKATIASFAAGESGIVNNQWASPTNAYFNEDVRKADKHAKADLATARRILDEEGINPSDHTLEIISWDLPQNQVYVEMVRALGFKVDYIPYEDLGLQQRLDRYDWDIVLAGSGPRADVYLQYVVMTSDGPNVRFTGGIQDPEFDAALKKAVTTPDFETRKNLYLDAAKIIADKHYVTVINQSSAAFGVRNEVHGFEFGYTYSPHYAAGGLAHAWLSKK